MSMFFSSTGAVTFSIIVIILQCISLVFMVALIWNFGGFYRRRIEILEALESPTIVMLKLQKRILASVYLALTVIIAITSSAIFFSQ